MKEECQGGAICSDFLELQTDRWKLIRNSLPIFYSTRGIKTWNNRDYMGDLLFESQEDSLQNVKSFLEKQMEVKASLLHKFSITFQDLEEVSEENKQYIVKGEESEIEWSSDDDCYYFIFEQYLNDLPILTDRYQLNTGEGLLPKGTITIGYTKRGIEYFQSSRNFNVIGKQKEEIASPEQIFETLKGKFELLIGENITITEMKLIYFPYYRENTRFDFRPVWRMTCKQEEREKYIYIDAITGNEVIQ